MAKKLSKNKAEKILHDKQVKGHPLTEKQRKFFGAVASGAVPKAQIGISASESTALPRSLDPRIKAAIEEDRKRAEITRRIANQPVLKPASKPIDKEETKRKNKAAASKLGLNYDEKTGSVSAPFSPQTERILSRAQENIVEPMLELEGLGIVGSLAKQSAKRAVEQIPVSNAAENIFSFKKTPIPNWLEEQMRFTSLPELNNPQASEVLENFMKRINTEEGKKRLKELGITNTDVFSNLKIVGDENTLGQYWMNRIGLHPKLPEVKRVTRHEIEHSVQDAYNTSRIEQARQANTWYDKFLEVITGKEPKKLTDAYKDVTTDIDKTLQNLELRKTPQEVDWESLSSKSIGEKKDPTKLFDYMSDKQRATNYFTSGGQGKEKSAFLSEVQQYMMDKGIIPKTSYTKVTPEMVKDVYADAIFDEKEGGKYLRLFNIMKPTEANYKLVSEGLNKMLGVAPLAMMAGAATTEKKQQGGSVESRMGGLTDKGFNYNGAWGGQFAMGGMLPGVQGHMYARTGAPSEGKYAKKTLPSAAEGYEVLPDPTDPERKYKLSAVVQSAKDILNPVLRSKNPKLYDEWHKGRVEALKAGNVEKYDVEKPLPFYLTPEEVKGELSKYNKRYYDEYISSLRELNAFKGLGRESYMGTKEGEKPLEDLLYGHRLSTALVNLGAEDSSGKGFRYSYNPSTEEYKKEILKNGGTMSYYQHGLDFKPKTISKKGSKIKKDNDGYWNPENWGKPVQINSNEITMQGVYEPLLGVSDTGDTQMMFPGQDYTFEGNSVTEYPIAQNGINQLDAQPNKKLDQLFNFTNFNDMANAKKGKKIPKGQSGVPRLDFNFINSAIDAAKPDIFTPQNIGAGIQAGSKIGQAVQRVMQAVEQKKMAKQTRALATPVAKAAATRDVDAPNMLARQMQANRPEYNLVTANDVGVNPFGTGYDVLSMAQNGAEIQNTYAPNTLYNDLGYEPLDESSRVKQFERGGGIPKAPLGTTLNLIGQGANVAGDIIAGIIGLGTKKMNQQSNELLGQAAFQSGMQGVLGGQYGAYMKNGGNIDDEYKWVSHSWQPQVIAKFGEHNVKDLLKPDPMMNTLRAGGHLKEYTPPSERAMSTERPQFAMGGELNTHWGGDMELASYNPYMPGSGETHVARGLYHSESDGKGNTGIGMSYGGNMVEVENGEPIIEMQEGGSVQDKSAVVFGNLKIPSYVASELGDKDAKGKMFKSYVNDLSKKEAKQNKIVDKALKITDLVDGNSSFDLLSMNTAKAMLTGADMKLKEIAQKKMMAAGAQQAMHETADEQGFDVEQFINRGKIVQAKNGANTAQSGTSIVDYMRSQGEDSSFKRRAELAKEAGIQNYKGTASQNIELLKYVQGKKTQQPQQPATPYQPAYTPIKLEADLEKPKFMQPVDFDKPLYTPQGIPELGDVIQNRYDVTGVVPEELSFRSEFYNTPEKKKGKVKGEGKMKALDIAQMAYNELLPFIRPVNQMELDPSQLAGEMMALSTNVLEPVQAQFYQPMLEARAPKMTAQEALNRNQADFNALARQIGNNPAAMSVLAAQKQAADRQAIAQAEAFNIQQEMATRNRNIAMLNDASLKNLAIADTQFGRQAQAKSATKAQAQAALSSIASKIGQNKLENLQSAVMQNMYNYRFGPRGRIINYNPLAQFNIPQIANLTEEEREALKKQSEGRTTAKNGSIVKAIKNL